MFCRVDTPRYTHKKALVAWGEIVPPLHTIVSELLVLSFSINQHFREILLVFIFYNSMLAIQLFNEYTEFPK